MTDVNKKSGQEVAKHLGKQDSPAETDSKSVGKQKTKGRDAAYWKGRLFRASYTRNGEKHLTKDWCVRIQHLGKRKVFNLETPNQAAAAKRAQTIDAFLRVNGWDKTEQKFCHGEERDRIKEEKDQFTIGQYLELAKRKAADPNGRTWQDYEAALRRITGELLGTKKRSVIDSTPIAFLTYGKIEDWKTRRKKACIDQGKSWKAGKSTANSILRNAKAPFGRKIIPALRSDGVKLPSPLPFEGVRPFADETTGKFKSNLDTAKLVRNATLKLNAPQGEDESDWEFEARLQLYLAFVLVFAGGLRKKEADLLEWSSIDFERSEITVRGTDKFTAKTAASEDAPIRLDPETRQIIQRYRAKYPKDRFVLRSRRKPKTGIRYSYYRAIKTWDRLRDWLKAEGVNDPKPIHYCRKAITSLIAKKQGIYAAQSFARHTTPQITARYYAERESVAPEIGSLFDCTEPDEPETVIEGDFQDSAELDRLHKPSRNQR